MLAQDGLIGLAIAPHLINCNDHVGPLENLNQLIQDDAFVGARLWLQVFFKNTLRIADGLRDQLVAAHANSFADYVALAFESMSKLVDEPSIECFEMR